MYIDSLGPSLSKHGPPLDGSMLDLGSAGSGRVVSQNARAAAVGLTPTFPPHSLITLRVNFAVAFSTQRRGKPIA